MIKIRKLKESPNYEAVVAWVGPFGDETSDGVSRVHFDDERVNKFLAEKGATRESVIDSYHSWLPGHQSGFLSRMSDTRFVKTNKAALRL